MQKSELKCLYWNIHGIYSKILGEKNKDPHFLSIIQGFDVIAISELHTKVNILKVRDIFYQEISSFVNKYFRGELPEVFTDYFQYFRHTYGTRGNLNRLILPLYRTELGKKTVRYKGCEIWNNLSQGKKNIKNAKRFRKSIKDSIIMGYRTIDLLPTSLH